MKSKQNNSKKRYNLLDYILDLNTKNNKNKYKLDKKDKTEKTEKKTKKISKYKKINKKHNEIYTSKTKKKN